MADDANAKKIWEALPEDGSKWSEKDIKALTDLNIGKIKDAKKWMKEHELIQSYRGRGGYISRLEGAEFPQEENTMTAGEKRAASKAASKAAQKEQEERRELEAEVLAYVKTLPEAKDADEIQIQWVNLQWWDVFYTWIWHGKSAKGYKVYTEDMRKVS